MAIKLYPPNIEGTIPAFATNEDGTTTLVVPFSLNKAVSIDDISGFIIKIKTISGQLIGTVKATSWDLENLMEAYFDLSPLITQKVIKLGLYKLGQVDPFQIGQFYKIQLAFLNGETSYKVTNDTSPLKGKEYFTFDEYTGFYIPVTDTNSDFDPGITYYEANEDDVTVGYYSTVGVTKYTIAPKVSIESLLVGEINSHRYYYTGIYSQENGDVLEKLYSSRFKVYDQNKNLIADSGDILHNTQLDDSDKNEQYETFNLSEDLELNKNYFITYTATTVNKMVVSSNQYVIMQQKTVDPEINAVLNAELNYENGYISIYLQGELDEDGYEKLASGAFVVLRNSSKNPSTWDEIYRFNLVAENPSRLLWRDFTIEQGVTYKYAIQQYNDIGLYSNRIVSNSVYGDFEHAFIFDGTKQLKIKYNPKVASFKNDVLEQKIDTIGSKHPFIFRNGSVNYKEFSVSGLISYSVDEEELFATKEEILASADYTFDIYAGENVASERLFKLKALEWLTDGKPKVFRSPTEGNYIVRLLNTSLSPNDTLGRLLHTFSSTAYEITDFNYTNLRKYNFIKEKNQSNVTYTRYKTVNLVNANGIGYKTNILEGHYAYSLKFENVYPAVWANITILNENNIPEAETYFIGGGSRTFEYKSDNPIINIRIVDSVGDPEELSGQLTYSYKIEAANVFNTYSNLTIKNLPLKQFIGTNNIHSNILAELENVKTQFSELYTIEFRKKVCTPIYIQGVFVEEEYMDLIYYADQAMTQRIDIHTNLIPLEIYEIFTWDGITTNYFINGYDLSIFKTNPLNYNCVIDDATISLNPTLDLTDEIPPEQQSFTIQDASDIKVIYLYPGVYANATLQIIDIDYTFEETQPVLDLKNNYLGISEMRWDEENLESIIDTYTINEAIDIVNNQHSAMLGAENNYHLALERAINQYKEMNTIYA